MDSQFSQSCAQFLQSTLVAFARYIQAHPDLPTKQENEIVEALRGAYGVPTVAPRITPAGPLIMGLNPAIGAIAPTIVGVHPMGHTGVPIPFGAPAGVAGPKKTGRTSEKAAATAQQRNISRDEFFAEVKRHSDARAVGQQAPYLCAYQAPRTNPGLLVCAGPATVNTQNPDYTQHRCAACTGKIGNISKQPKGGAAPVYAVAHGTVQPGFNIPGVGAPRLVGAPNAPYVAGAPPMQPGGVNAPPPPPTAADQPQKFAVMLNDTLEKGHYLAKNPGMTHYLIRANPISCVGKFGFACEKTTQFPANHRDLIQPLEQAEIANLETMGVKYKFKDFVTPSPVAVGATAQPPQPGQYAVPVPQAQQYAIPQPGQYAVPVPAAVQPIAVPHPITVPQPAHPITVPQPAQQYAVQVPQPAQQYAVQVPQPAQQYAVQVPQPAHPIAVPQLAQQFAITVPQVAHPIVVPQVAHPIAVPQPQQFTIPQPQQFTIPQPQQFTIPQPQAVQTPQPTQQFAIPQPQAVQTPQPQQFAIPQPQQYTNPEPQAVQTPQPQQFAIPQPQQFAIPQPQQYAPQPDQSTFTLPVDMPQTEQVPTGEITTIA
jgi:hypothetical protein